MSYFSALIILVHCRRKMKLVMKLRDDCGIWINDQKLIVDKFILDYTQWFRSGKSTRKIVPNLGPKLISDIDNNDFIKLPNLEKVRIALFSMNSNKTPGFDDFGAGFFKNYWHIIKRIFLTVLHNFLWMGRFWRKLIILSLPSLPGGESITD